jgi:hypothetical protein
VKRPVDDHRHWYDCAAEIRALSDAMEDAAARSNMRRLADVYDELGDRAQELSGQRLKTEAAPRKAKGPPPYFRI